MATAAAVSPSWVSDTWIVTSAKCLAIAPVNRTRGRPHMSVTTSISRWMSSRNTGRCANRDPDQALITASFAAHRAARCRAADELLSEASRRSPGVNVSENAVPGWSTCSAKSGMETRSIPTPTMLMVRQANLSAESFRGGPVGVVITQSCVRIQQHRRLLPLLRRVVIEATVCGPLVHRRAPGDGRREPALTGQQAGGRSLLGVRPLLRVQRSDERLRVRQRDEAGHVAEPEAGQHSRLQRELAAQPQGVADPHEVG